MGLGFAFLMAIFPFHSWIPMLGEEAHPYAAAFIFFLLPAIVSILGLEFLSRYPWLQGEPVIRQALSLLGAVMVLIGGLWAPFQRHLGRIMGYAVIVEIGLSLLALSLEFSMRDNQPVVGPPQAPILGSSPELGIFFALFLPRALALGTWGLALATLRAKAGDLKFRSVYGLGRQLPIVASSLVLAHFSMAGFPLLAGFPTHIALWSALAEQSNALTLLALLGSAGLMGAGLRTLAILVMGNQEQAWQAQESRMQAILLSLAALMIIGLGLTPGWMLPAMNSLLRILGGG
jgi:NADH:ubiquinone oxidoreductase subunit 2 (subunit N)